MSGKRPELSAKVAPRLADAWVKQGTVDSKCDPRPTSVSHSARLTVDITPALRRSIKLAAISQGVTVAQLLRGMLDREFGHAQEAQS